jgi:prepilin-type N-terminal cleavage/methylation domain-containing protein
VSANSRSAARGFTLVELLVAMAAGLIVAAAAVLLSRNAARLFHEETRLSAAHLAAVLGLSRITADVQRAALLSTPNAQRDPWICGDKAAWPEGLRRLAGISIARQGSVLSHPGELDQSLANGLAPDALIIGGAFGIHEPLPIRLIQPGPGGGQDVYLQISGSGAMQRLRASAAAGGAGLAEIFRPGRLLRVVLPGQSRHAYGVIAGIEVIDAPLAQVIVRLAPAPALPRRDAGGCGLGHGANVGGLASPVSRIRYDIRRLAGHPAYGALVAPVAPEMTGDDGRTELVRVELDADDQEMPGTLELVAEYAVDLKLGVAILVPGAPGAGPAVERRPIAVPEDLAAYAIAADPTEPGARPERVRAVHIRLATRVRAPDRNMDLVEGPDGRRARFLIPGLAPGALFAGDTAPPGAPPVYARLRTLYTDVALPNQVEGGAW